MTHIAVAGIGRMGKGIALAFAWAGREVVLVDSEDRARAEFAELERATQRDLAAELQFLQESGALSGTQSAAMARNIRIVARADAAADLGHAEYVFEAVVEVLDIKRRVYAWLNEHVGDAAIVSSTTSTMSANDLAACVAGSERFVNAHWLNPAHLMPLVEVSPGERTSQRTVDAMKALLEGIGKHPVVCRASPGFIVPRIQALAMNEAARIIQEGIATADDVDHAVKVGFGIRFATLGLLEFIDWGGGDILYHATGYLAQNLDPDRFRVPDIVRENMARHRNGLRDGIGFYDWKDRDVEAYRKQKMAEFIRLLQHRGLMPQPAAEHGASAGNTGDDGP